MFFNYDELEIITLAFLVSGILIYSFYSSSFTVQNKNESLVNTNDSLNSISKLDNIPYHVNVEAKVNTDHIKLDLKFRFSNKIDNKYSQSLDIQNLENSLTNNKIGINSKKKLVELNDEAYDIQIIDNIVYVVFDNIAVAIDPSLINYFMLINDLI